jgi:DNA-binding NarL/FixJ family response regulator
MEPARPDHAARPLQVLVVDADRRVRQSLAGLIDLADGMAIVGAAADAAGALAGLAAGPVDVVVLDPRLPEFDAGKGLVGAIHRGWPGTCIVALYWPEEPSGLDGTHLTVAPSSVQPDSLVELLRSCAVAHRRDAAAGLS